MRVAIVNDVKMASEVLRRVVASLPEAEIAWMAEDGQQAVQRCQEDRPDVILMDMIMPVMDGVEATRQIMLSCPCPILVVTATVSGNANLVYEALGCGATDAVNTPILGPGGDLSGAEDLVRKLRNVARLSSECSPAVSVPSWLDTTRPADSSSQPPLVAIGASTGGPQALLTVLRGLRRPLAGSIIVVQHLDEHFVDGLGKWLAGETGLDVQVALPGDLPEPGTIRIACTTDHLVLDRHGRFWHTAEPVDFIHRPSIDVLFGSLLRAPAPPGTGVLLTGMGRDGAAGLKRLRDAGWDTIAQDEASSVVWGMPRAAIQMDAANHVLAIDQIGLAINRRFGVDSTV
jgi:two-component system response regulator WspF